MCWDAADGGGSNRRRGARPAPFPTLTDGRTGGGGGGGGGEGCEGHGGTVSGRKRATMTACTESELANGSWRLRKAEEEGDLRGGEGGQLEGGGEAEGGATAPTQLPPPLSLSLKLPSLTPPPPPSRGSDSKR